MGRNVIVNYDKFFKSYYIIFENEKGVLSSISLSFLKNEGKGIITMKDKSNSIFHVFDKLNSIGKFYMVYDKSVDGLMALVLIEDVYKID